MTPPIIFWHWQNLPSNSDEVQPLAMQTMKDGSQIALFYNKTQDQLVIEHEGYYGVIVEGEG